MPQFNSYPAIVELLAADLILVYKASVGAVKTITAENFAASMKALISRALEITVVNSSDTLSDEEFVVGNSGSTFTLTLPLTTANPGRPFYVSNKGLGTITMAPNGSDTIAGQASFPVPQYASYIFIPDGLGMWHVFSFTP